jgi:hypothetical protein
MSLGARLAYRPIYPAADWRAGLHANLLWCAGAHANLLVACTYQAPTSGHANKCYAVLQLFVVSSSSHQSSYWNDSILCIHPGQMRGHEAYTGYAVLCTKQLMEDLSPIHDYQSCTCQPCVILVTCMILNAQ